MKYTSCPYQSENDLYEIGRLIRRAYTRNRYFNAWSFCRHDIWAQRRIADATSFNDNLWQKHFQLVHDENGIVAGAAVAFDNHHWRKNPEPYALILDPNQPQPVEVLLDWAEAGGMLETEIIQGNTFLSGLIQSRAYIRSSDFMILHEKQIKGTALEPVDLPEGIRSLC